MQCKNLFSASLIGFLVCGCANLAPSKSAPETQNLALSNSSQEIKGVLSEFRLRLDTVKLAIDSNELGKIHNQAEEMVHCQKAISGLYRPNTPGLKKKMKKHLRQLSNLIYWLHEYADARDASSTRETLNSLVSELNIVEGLMNLNQE